MFCFNVAPSLRIPSGEGNEPTSGKKDLLVVVGEWRITMDSSGDEGAIPVLLVVSSSWYDVDVGKGSAFVDGRWS